MTDSIRFSATERVAIPVRERSVPIRHYLRQPQRLVHAIARPNPVVQLSPERFRLTMRPISLMAYRFQPVVELQVTAASDGTLHLRSRDCQIRGNDYINARFGLAVRGQLAPEQNGATTCLRGQADLTVTVDLPPPLQLTPRPWLQRTGNGLLKSILARMAQRLRGPLIADYQQWASEAASGGMGSLPHSRAERPPA